MPSVLTTGVHRNVRHQPSSHRTTLAGASVELDWIGTAIYLYGDASAGSLGYTVQFDGVQSSNITISTGLLFSQSQLNYGPHSLVLMVVQGQVSISNSTITVGMGKIG